MIREEIIADAIEAAMNDVHDMDVTFRDYAKAAAEAVLDLCGPKPLTWEVTGVDRYSTKNYDVKVVTDGNGWATCPENWPPFGGYPYPTLEAAQSAAQTHYDAAHWAGTKLGDME